MQEDNHASAGPSNGVSNGTMQLLDIHIDFKNNNNDYIQLLEDVAKEQNFEISYVEFSHSREHCVCVICISTKSKNAFYGDGANQQEARVVAA